VAVKVHGGYIVVIGGKQQQSVSLEIIVVVVAAVCATVAWLGSLLGQSSRICWQ